VVVYQDWRGGGAAGQLDYVRYAQDWGRAEHLFPGLISLHPTLHVEDDGRVKVAFLGQLDSADPMRSVFFSAVRTIASEVVAPRPIVASDKSLEAEEPNPEHGMCSMLRTLELAFHRSRVIALVALMPAVFGCGSEGDVTSINAAKSTRRRRP